jgi:hypothetical protein
MSDSLKKIFNEKMHVGTSKHFDMDFKRKLEHSLSNKSLFNRWYAFGAVGAVTLMLFLFMMKGNFNVSFKNSHYMNSVIELEREADDSATDDFTENMIDLTSEPTDEI